MDATWQADASPIGRFLLEEARADADEALALDLADVAEDGRIEI